MITKLFETIKCGDVVFHVWEDGEITPPQLVTPEVQEYVGDLKALYRVNFGKHCWEFENLVKSSKVIDVEYIKVIENFGWDRFLVNSRQFGLASFKNGKVIPFNTL